MLPFTKRPNRPEDADVVDSGEIEVVRVAPSAPPPSRLAPTSSRPNSTRPPVSVARPLPPPPVSQRYPAPPSDRPRVFDRSVDEEMTSVMPSKRGSSFPPASSHAPRSSTRPRPGGPARDDEERTMLRPMTPAQSFVPRAAPSTRTVPPPASVGRPAAFVPPPPPVPNGFGLHVQTPPTMLGQSAIPTSVRAQALAAVRAHQSGQVYASGQLPAYAMPSPTPSGTIPPAPPSDPAINPPATVITTRTRVLIGRPTMSWAAALLAMGVFVGLVTAVVARGDADSLIDATASFVDPAHSTAKAAAGQPAATPAPLPAAAPIAPPVVAPIAAPAPLPVAANPAPITPPAPVLAPIPMVDKPGDPVKTISTNDLPTANATPDKKPPVAYAAPAPKPEPKVAAAPRYYSRPKPAADSVAVATPKPAPAPRAKKVAASSADDDGAAAADKLAREQLEAALK